MFGFIKRLFTWWHDSTVGTQLYTLRQGVFVGADNQGNRYYRAKNEDRRWVIYNGEVEASRIPPEWHAWLHKTVDLTPVESPPLVKAWEKEHAPNLTGGSEAYFPPGSLYRSGKRARATGDYEPWTP